MQVNLCSSLYMANKCGFKGTVNPKTPAEKMQRLLRDIYHSANIDGRSGMNSDFVTACNARTLIVELLKNIGAVNIAEKLNSVVREDTIKPTNPSENLIIILRSLYNGANYDGKISRQEGFALACGIKQRIAGVIKGVNADVAEIFQKPVEDDLLTSY